MHIQKKILEDKIALFAFAGIAQNEGRGWDYAIPQSMFDDLQCMGIENPGQWFAADCTNISTKLHHIGEAYVAICSHRSKANQEQWESIFKMRKGDAQEKAFANFLYHSPDNRILDEADAGFLDLNFVMAAFNCGWVGGSRWQEQFLIQSAWSEKRKNEQRFCFVIRTKEYACSGTNYAVHMMTEDGGFHHGDYCNEAVDAMARFLERCKLRNLSPLPLVNEN